MAASVGLDAVSAATLADELLAQGEPLQSVWRYVIVQLLDDYTHDLARSGATAASQRFTSEPPPTSSAEVDAALPDPNAVRYFEAPGLLVDVASAEYLLAMKLFSSRVETDAEDIALLYSEVGYRTVDEGLALVERSYPGRPIAAKVQFLLAEIVEALNAQ